MKQKLLLFALLLCTSAGAFASTLVQRNWRWRNDDGNETTATFKAAQNTAITINDYGVIRLRVRVETESTSDTHNVGALKYSTSANGLADDFIVIDENTTTNAFVYANSSVAPDSKAPTTNSTYLTTVNTAGLNPFSYSNGEYFDGNRDLVSNADKAAVNPSSYSDMEFVIKPTANILPNTTYYFVIENAKSNSGEPMANTNNLATLATAAVLPVQFLSFEAKPVNNSVQLKWSTASEKNNDRFEVSRSNDGKTWQVIATKSGQGNTNTVSQYHFQDNSPLSGISYYQLAQFDHDGTKTVLSTKVVSLSVGAAVDVQVFPNPTSQEINLAVANYQGKNVEASLYSQDGKLIHKEQLKKDSQLQKLNISKMPGAGIYILKVVGEGLAVNKKVVIL